MKPIQLDFKPSIILSTLITAVSLGACCILILLALSWQIKLLLGLVIVISAIYAVCNYCLLSLPWSSVALKINTKNQLQLTRKDGKQLEVTVQANSVVTPYLTVLNCQLKNDDQSEGISLLRRLLAPHFTTRSLIILPDAVDAERYRQLRVWLRWGCARQLR
ncbi:MAG: protein YgfX [Methylotenera sp.]